MTLPSSGPIAMSQIMAEYGKANNAVFPNAIYGMNGVPASGAVSFGQLYGVTYFTISANKSSMKCTTASGPQNVIVTATGPATYTYSVISGTQPPAAQFIWTPQANSTQCQYTIQSPVPQSYTWTIRIVGTSTVTGVQRTVDVACTLSLT
jgi:hypothetical protein